MSLLQDNAFLSKKPCNISIRHNKKKSYIINVQDRSERSCTFFILLFFTVKHNSRRF